ncbi:MAG: riboflavin synthase [Planctomycetaceae bacterium]|nr:riboflavin synthase [Planctomycetaceae bacterium]
MFSGIVEKLGLVRQVEEQPPGVRLTLEVGKLAEEVAIGESVAINGCCLTAIESGPDWLVFEAGEETRTRTNLGDLRLAGRVNIERSMRLSDRLSGHFVTGHVDAVGTLEERIDDGDWSTCWFQMPQRLACQMASKGSVAVDGVSLTLVDVDESRFSVALIPHTLQVTTLGQLQLGDPVNLETDVLAKYVQQQLEHRP